MSLIAEDVGILVGVDGSAPSDAALRFATREALMRKCPLTVMHVVQPAPAWATSAEQSRLQQVWQDNAREVIDQARKTAYAGFVEGASLDLHVETPCAPVAPMFVVASTHCTMLVVGSRGMTRLNQFLLGSVSTTTAQHAQCPVVIVHADDNAGPDVRPIVVGVDGSQASEGAIEFAFEEASRRGVDLVALHAWSDVGVLPILGMDWRDYEVRGAEILSERLAGYQQEYPDVVVRRRLVCDKPARWLIEESERAQLVVVGRRGRGGFAGLLLGSVSSAVAQAAAAPVAVVG